MFLQQASYTPSFGGLGISGAWNLRFFRQLRYPRQPGYRIRADQSVRPPVGDPLNLTTFLQIRNQNCYPVTVIVPYHMLDFGLKAVRMALYGFLDEIEQSKVLPMSRDFSFPRFQFRNCAYYAFELNQALFIAFQS